MNKEKQIEITEKAIRSSKDNAGAFANLLNQEIKELQRVKAKQIEEMANVPTKEEQITRAKRAKEKDDLVKELLHYANNELAHGIKNLIDCESCANYLIDNLGYRKIAENEVVISKEEYENIWKKGYEEGYSILVNDTIKKTAEKIYTFVNSFGTHNWERFMEFIKQFGVEIKE